VSRPTTATFTTACGDGTSITLSNSEDGLDGDSCSVVDDGDGSRTFFCEDRTEVTVADGADGDEGSAGTDGQDGTPCTVAENDDNTTTVECTETRQPSSATSAVTSGWSMGVRGP
jgi:hypothetical protein